MILDSERQRGMLLGLIINTTFKGESVEQLYFLKKAVEEAEVRDDESPD